MMSRLETASHRDAMLRALQDELRSTLDAYAGDGRVRRALSFPAYHAELRGARDVLELRSAFSLARRRADAAPPSPQDVRDALEELQARAAATPRTTGATTTHTSIAQEPTTPPAPVTRPPTPGTSVLPPTPRFDAAADWCAAHPGADALVERELEALTSTWDVALRAERERLRPVARLLVFNRHARREARTA